MSSRLIELSYFDPKANIRLTAYADTVMLENTGEDSIITAIRFGGYPEMVRAMSDAIYGGGTVEAVRNGEKRQFKSNPKGYRRQLAHDGVYATATLMAEDDKPLEIIREKVNAGERVLVYTSWTRTDSQQKLMKLLAQEGYRTEILPPTVVPEKREAWVEKRVRAGLQVLITNPRCVETGLDLNAFTTLIFYSMGFNLFTLRQASRRSWRINQTAPRVEVYLLYYKDTMQAKAMKLMASKLAVAGIIEGTLSEEGLAAMSDVRDLTSQMAKELTLGIKDNVEDIAAAFKKMAVINPNRRAVQPAARPTENPPALEAPTIKDTSAHARRKEFDGLLERTLAEQKKKKKPKKPVVDEDQFTLDGFAA